MFITKPSRKNFALYLVLDVSRTICSIYSVWWLNLAGWWVHKEWNYFWIEAFSGTIDTSFSITKSIKIQVCWSLCSLLLSEGKSKDSSPSRTSSSSFSVFPLLHSQHPFHLIFVHMRVYLFCSAQRFICWIKLACSSDPSLFSTSKAVAMDTYCIVTFQGRAIICQPSTEDMAWCRVLFSHTNTHRLGLNCHDFF